MSLSDRISFAYATKARLLKRQHSLKGDKTMAATSIKFLGELVVSCDSERLPLPPSKKTRALLAYLALNHRAYHREILCELLWEIPDDPRGSLRWSLSKLRKLVDAPEHPRIIADRTNIRLEVEGLDVDVLNLYSGAQDGFKSLTLAQLTALAEQSCGIFLEGLELDQFHDFSLWLMAEREKVVQAQIGLCSELTGRLPPAEALRFARERVRLEPNSVAAQEQVLRLMVSQNQLKEAEKHYQIAKRVLREYGVDDQGILYRALHKPSAGASEIRGSLETDQAAPQGASPSPTRGPIAQVPVADVNEVGAQRRLIGRDEEGQRLYSLYLAAIQNQRASCVLLRGEPGIGKSFLLQVLVKVARKGEVFLLHADAFESETVRPFGLWSDAFRRAPAQSLPEVLNGEDRHSRDRIFAGLSDLVKDHAQDKPVLIIFDDVQWCDESSAATLHYLLRMNAQQPIFVLLAARTQELQTNSSMQKTLNGLRSEQMLHEFSLEPLAPEWLEQIIRFHNPQAEAGMLASACHGNPLLAVEIARAQMLAPQQTSDSLHQLIQERMANLDEISRSLIYWCAVMETNITAASLQRLAEVSQDLVEIALEQAEQQRLIVATDRGVRFIHNSVGQCIYRQISLSRRRSMHYRVAEMLESDCQGNIELAADLAYHGEKSKDPALATRAMVSAGKLCLRFFALSDAVSLARKGIEFAKTLHGVEKDCRLLELYDVLWQADPVEDWVEAAELAVSLAERALDHGALHHARLGYQTAAYLKWIHGDWSDARRDSLHAERVSRAGPKNEHLRGMAEAARCLVLLERDLSRADAMLMEAKSLAKREELYLPVLAHVDGMMCYHRGEFGPAEELLQEARAGYKAKGDRLSEYQANEYLVMLQIDRGRFDLAARYSKGLLAIGEKLKQGSEAVFARAMVDLCGYQTNPEQYFEGLSQQLQCLRECDAKHRLAFTLVRTAIVDARSQRWLKALECAKEALQYTELLHRPSEQLLAHSLLAVSAHYLGDEQAHKRHFSALTDIRQRVPTLAHWAVSEYENLMTTEEA